MEFIYCKVPYISSHLGTTLNRKQLHIGDISLWGVCEKPNYHPSKYLLFEQRIAQLCYDVWHKYEFFCVCEPF